MYAAPIPFRLSAVAKTSAGAAAPAPAEPSGVPHQFVEPLPSPAAPSTIPMGFAAEDVALAINELRRVIGPKSHNAMTIAMLSMRANIHPALMTVAVMHLHFFSEIRRRHSDDKTSYVYFAAQRLRAAGPPVAIPDRLQAFPMPRQPRSY